MDNILLFFKKLDWKLNVGILFLAFASLLSLLSTNSELFYKQIIWWALGIILAFILIRFDWRPFINYRSVIFSLYFVIIGLLVATYFFAPTVRGIKGWLPIGNFQFQAAEFTKVVLIILFAYFFQKKHIQIAKISNLITSFIYFFIPAILIALQPDLGSVLVLFSVWFGFLLVSGIRWRHLLIALIIFVILAMVMWAFVLKDYQKDRIFGLFSPNRDPLGINYSVIQSKIAIGSAGFLGKGFRQGTQIQLGFLPEAQTDFIFAAIIEEIGLLMGFVLIFVLFGIIFRIIKIGLSSDNNFSRFVCLGTAILFSVQFILNVGSNIGLTPVIGVTFPFLSYGGSSLLTNLILVGIIQSIFLRKS